jgi:hypothetical protein
VAPPGTQAAKGESKHQSDAWREIFLFDENVYDFALAFNSFEV